MLDTTFLSAIFFGLVGIGFFMYAAGASRAAKAILIALVSAVAIGYIAGLIIIFALALTLDISGEWSGIALYVIGLFAGLVAAALGFVVVFLILLKRFKPVPPQPKMRLASAILAAASLLFTLGNIYIVAPSLHPTSQLIKELAGFNAARYSPAMRELIRRGNKVIPAIMDKAAADPHGDHTYALAEIVGQIPGEASTEALFVLLDHPNRDVRVQAAVYLSARKEESALDILLEKLADPQLDYQQKSGIINAITQFNDPSAVPRMLAVLGPPAHDGGGGSRRFSYDVALVRAMGTLKHPQAYEFLVRLHDHPRERVRLDVIEQLRNYPCRRTAMILIGSLDDPDISVRREADKALAKIVGVRWNSSGRRHSAEGSKEVKSDWLMWMEKNNDKLPEEFPF